MKRRCITCNANPRAPGLYGGSFKLRWNFGRHEAHEDGKTFSGETGGGFSFL